MTRIISIIMAIIIMLTAGINTEIITASAKSPTTVSASVKTKSSPKKNKKKNKKKTKSKKTKKNKKKNKKKKQKHVHYMPKGNMGKWFNSKQELKEYASSVMEEYNRQYEEGEITWNEYVQRCPYGYEAWSCSCGKWTGNFKHH